METLAYIIKSDIIYDKMQISTFNLPTKQTEKKDFLKNVNNWDIYS